MTDRLRQALAEAGAAAPTFDLYEQALADGRRLRRRRNGRAAVGAAFALLLAVALPGAIVGAGSAPGGFAAGGGSPSLPDRIRTSWPWTATVQQAPPGPAALVVGQHLGDLQQLRPEPRQPTGRQGRIHPGRQMDRRGQPSRVLPRLPRTRFSQPVADPAARPRHRGRTTWREPAEVRGMTALRLIGWWPSGEAVVAAHYPHPGSPARWNPAAADPNHDPWAFPNYYESVSHVEVRALAAEGGSREPLSLPGAVYGVDIADDVLAAGLVRPGGDAPIRPVRTGWLVATTAVAVLLVTTPVAVVLLIRRWRRIRRAATPTGGQRLSPWGR